MEDLLLYLNIIKKRWPWALIVFGLVFYILGVERASKTVPLYRASGLIIFDSDSANLAEPFSLSLGNKNNLNNNLVMIKSETLAREVKKDLEFPLNLDTKQLLKNLVAVNPEKSDVIELSYVDEDPEKATAIINTWIQNYANLDKELQTTQSKELAEFLEKQIPQNQRDLEITAEKLKDFKKDNRILDITAEAGSTIKIISELDSQKAALQAQLASLKSRKDSLQEIFPVDSQTAITSSFVNESPIVKSLIVQIQEVQTKINEEKLRFGDQHPQVISLQQQEQSLRNQLEEYSANIFVDGNTRGNSLDNIYQPGTNQSTLLAEYASTDREIKSLEAQLASLNQLIDNYRQRVDTLPNLEFEQQQLQRELVARDELVQDLVKTYQDAQIALNNTQGTIRSIEYAYVPVKPAVDRKLMYYVQGLIAGLIAGFIAAYLVEQLDTGIRNVDQVKDYFDLPIFAEIPELNKKLFTSQNFNNNNDNKPLKAQNNNPYDLPVKDYPLSPVSEAFRGICTSIKFMSTEDKAFQVLTISSSVAGEGKSTLAANTAIAASEMGGKVLIIEADLRKPGQQKIWHEIKDTQERKLNGLGDLLQPSHNLDWRQQTINLLPNLDILPAGQSKSNPVALIGSPEMVHLIDELKTEYTWIIIDAPPVSVAADAQILGRMSDGMLMVIRQGKANTSMLRVVSQTLKQSDVNVLGLILNCFASGSGASYYSNYSYNSSYYFDHQNSNKKGNFTDSVKKIFTSKK